ncbi:MAG: carboxypeptidase-like regulatory domain-containing protein [Bacteroidales bacterium]|jgi:hypothetical protein|nr:carboxypeptidase-like regulatory domain-containing protein [Bacteroidales bacterium]
MKKFIYLLFFFPFFVFSQERISLTGNVFDGVTFFPVDNANIYNFNTKQYVFSDKNGNFKVLTKIGDTLIVTKPAYRQILVEIDEKMVISKKLEFSLYYKAIILKEINVYAIPPTYEEFKKEFLNVKLSDIYKSFDGTMSNEEKLQYQQVGSLLDLIPGRMGQAIRSPITALYNAFSKKVKMERLYLEMVENEEEVKRLPLKYNRDIVSSLTGLEGEELLNFMTFCRFSYYDLIRWSQELILLQIQRKYGDYEFYKAMERE